jgi:O-antigen ligase
MASRAGKSAVPKASRVVPEVDPARADPAGFAPGRILIAAIAVTPLCLLPGVFLSHDLVPKLIAILCAAALLLFLLPRWGTAAHVLWAHRRGRYLLALAAAEISSLILSTLFSVQPALSLAGTVWRRFGAAEQIAIVVIAIAAASVAARNPRWPASLFRATSVTGGLAAIYGIAQYFGVDPVLDPALYTIQVFGGIIRPPATMGHAIYFAAWLVPVVLVAAARARTEPDRFWRVLHAVSAALGCLAIVLSGSRGGVLALITGGVVLIAGKRSPEINISSRRVLLSAAVVVAAAAILAISPAGANLRHRLVQWRQDPGGPRLLLWRESPVLLLNHPLLGTGPETFAGEFRKIESVNMSRAYPDFYHETPHNAFIDAADAQGLPGLLILLALFVLGFASANRGLRAALAGIFVASMFASFTLVEAIYLWTFVAIAIASETPSPAAIKPMPRLVLLAAALMGAAFLFISLSLAVPDAADLRVSTAVSNNDFAAGTTALRDSLAWSFGLPGYELYLSREMALLARSRNGTLDAAGAWSLAATAANAAEQRGEESFSAAFQASVLALASSDLPRAEQKARAAIALAPNWYKPHLLLAQLLQAAGKPADAATEQRLGVSLNPNLK